MAKAFVYWNFHKKVFSVKYRGLVIAHATRILVKRARFRVSEIGRQRVLSEGRKNVHAGITCELDDLYCDSPRSGRRCGLLTWPTETNILATNAQEYGQIVRYNPYNGATFVVGASFQPVKSAKTVYGVASQLSGTPTLWAERFA